ncbi:hypothetical protein RAN53_09665 [Halomonas sp. SSL-5]|uniref:hypothetical protein n=1 Tax=Halomonas sp. SSL-5 TaxID=3065855 RepID=UPI002738E09A|nr:hypothetical protein [Halomonas sp. SSL-5]MDY7116617.1 hypothetical protein [Halomonas sp. SSL-5]
MEQLLGETVTNIILAATCLLVTGGLVMTQLPGGIGMWLLVSFVAIPGFFMVAALLINVPGLLFGALILLGLYSFRH